MNEMIPPKAARSDRAPSNLTQGIAAKQAGMVFTQEQRTNRFDETQPWTNRSQPAWGGKTPTKAKVWAAGTPMQAVKNSTVTAANTPQTEGRVTKYIQV